MAEYSRGLSEEEACEQLVEIQGMWEMSSILDFLCVFKDVLKLDLDFTAESLEDAIVRSAGPGILAHIHMVSLVQNMDPLLWIPAPLLETIIGA